MQHNGSNVRLSVSRQHTVAADSWGTASIHYSAAWRLLSTLHPQAGHHCRSQLSVPLHAFLPLHSRASHEVTLTLLLALLLCTSTMSVVSSQQPQQQQWSAELYGKHGRFNTELAGDMLSTLAAQPGERILDLGCGDGALTVRLMASGATLVGVDASPQLVQAALAAGVDARLQRMQDVSFEGEFDAAFSNAALHWISAADTPTVLRNVYRALKPGARFVVDAGGFLNIAGIRASLRAALLHIGRSDLLAAENAQNYFPSAVTYRALLEWEGFVVDHCALIQRQTKLDAGGLRGWYATFRSGVLDALNAEQREAVLAETEQVLEPILSEVAADGSRAWVADYVRLRFYARKPSGQQ